MLYFDSTSGGSIDFSKDKVDDRISPVAFSFFIDDIFSEVSLIISPISVLKYNDLILSWIVFVKNQLHRNSHKVTGHCRFGY